MFAPRRARISGKRWRAGRGGVSSPVKTFLNGTIPALTNISVGIVVRHERRARRDGVTGLAENSRERTGGFRWLSSWLCS